MFRTALTRASLRGSAFWKSIHMPERFRGTIVEKWARFWEGLLRDYGDAARDCVTGIRQRPLRAYALAAAAAATGAAVHYNPSAQDYRCAVIHARGQVELVDPAVRNAASHQYVFAVEVLNSQKRIRRLNLGVVSLYWVDNWSNELGHVKAQCDYLKPSLLTWHKRVLDVGFWGQFWALKGAMLDYDVNPDEWASEQTL